MISIIEMIVSRHGARITGRETVKIFIEWVADMKWDLDLMEDIYQLPS